MEASLPNGEIHEQCSKYWRRHFLTSHPSSNTSYRATQAQDTHTRNQHEPATELLDTPWMRASQIQYFY